MNRRGLALKRDFTAITYASCRGCETGDQHAAQLLALATQQQEERPVEQQQEAAPTNGAIKHKYPPRMCRRGRHMFQPADDDPKGQVCADCAGKPKRGKLERLRARGKLKAKLAKDVPQAKPRVVPVLAKEADRMTAERWLELGGFRIETVTAPSGTWFRAVP